jgi:regulator of protease activity HflC (stomatin/prohibitin superfamily)
MSDSELPVEQNEAEVLLRRVADLVGNAKPIPLSTTVRLENKDEVLELLDEAIKRMPDEVKRARWLLKEREEFLAKTQREADELLNDARARAERMVQRTEIVRDAERTAQRTVEEAEEEARRLRHEAEDYCDQKLAAFEIVLERTTKTVQAGRERLRVTPLPFAGEGEVGAVEPDAHEPFFDQDEA